MSTTHHIAAIANRDGYDSQRLLEDIAAKWRDAGLRVVGLLAEDGTIEGECSAAFLRDIVSGQRFSIQLDTMPEGTSCHLDTAGLDQACADLLPQLADADLVILSKFGKTEAAGGGLRQAFAATREAGLPLLTTVSDKHVKAWEEFAPAMIWLEPEVEAIGQWREALTA